MKFTGKVIKTTLAGAAIDIGAEKPAMLHVSQLVSTSNEPILSVSDVLKEEEEIEVWVKRVRDQRIEPKLDKTKLRNGQLCVRTGCIYLQRVV